MPRQPTRRSRTLSTTSRLSAVAENYLLAVFQLDEQGTPATLTRLAEQLKRLPVSEGLGTTLPSVGGMVRRLAREGLVQTLPTKQVVLTETGRQSAEAIARRHRLAERMVADLLCVPLHRAHVEAHRLEHGISPELEARIAARLGHPQTCPFGAPIPGSGYRPPRGTTSLDRVGQGQTVVIDRVPEDDPDLLEYLVRHGLVPGRRVAVSEAALYRGVITLRGNGDDVVIGFEVATRVRVREPNGDGDPPGATAAAPAPSQVGGPG